MSDELTSAYAVIREAADSDLPAFQRLDRLRGIRRELEGALADTSAAIEVAEAAYQGEQVNLGLAVVALRERATTGENLLASGSVTEDELAESGILSHADLDALQEENLLEAVAQEWLDSGKLVLDTAA